MISPFFFLIGTHEEYQRGTIILTSNNFFTSFSITGNTAGLILLNFYLKGLTFGFKGTLCCIILVSYFFKSSYDQPKTSTYSFNNLMYLFLCCVVSAFEIFTILGCSLVPILQSITFSYEDCITGFKGVSSFEKILSKGTKPLGMKLPFSSMIL